MNSKQQILMRKAQQAQYQQQTQLKEFSSEEAIVPKTKPRVEEEYRTPQKQNVSMEEEKKAPIQQQQQEAAPAMDLVQLTNPFERLQKLISGEMKSQKSSFSQSFKDQNEKVQNKDVNGNPYLKYGQLLMAAREQNKQLAYFLLSTIFVIGKQDIVFEQEFLHGPHVKNFLKDNNNEKLIQHLPLRDQTKFSYMILNVETLTKIQQVTLEHGDIIKSIDKQSVIDMYLRERSQYFRRGELSQYLFEQRKKKKSYSSFYILGQDYLAQKIFNDEVTVNISNDLADILDMAMADLEDENEESEFVKIFKQKCQTFMKFWEKINKGEKVDDNDYDVKFISFFNEKTCLCAAVIYTAGIPIDIHFFNFKKNVQVKQILQNQIGKEASIKTNETVSITLVSMDSFIQPANYMGANFFNDLNTLAPYIFPEDMMEDEVKMIHRQGHAIKKYLQVANSHFYPYKIIDNFSQAIFYRGSSKIDQDEHIQIARKAFLKNEEDIEFACLSKLTVDVHGNYEQIGEMVKLPYQQFVKTQLKEEGMEVDEGKKISNAVFDQAFKKRLPKKKNADDSDVEEEEDDKDKKKKKKAIEKTKAISKAKK